MCVVSTVSDDPPIYIFKQLTSVFQKTYFTKKKKVGALPVKAGPQAMSAQPRDNLA